MISATQKVNMDDLVATAPVVSVEEALQGQLGGVDITLGGDPGTRSSIRIRGTGTLNASADPLIVIDGVPIRQISVMILTSLLLMKKIWVLF